MQDASYATMAVPHEQYPLDNVGTSDIISILYVLLMLQEVDSYHFISSTGISQGRCLEPGAVY